MEFLFKDLPGELCGRVAKTLNEKLFSKVDPVCFSAISHPQPLEKS
jgi:hypothetical protein